MFYAFANIFYVWINKRQLDSHICFCMQCVVISHIMQPLENSTVHLWEDENEKGKLCLITMNIFWLHERSSDSALKNAELDHIMPFLGTWQWLPKQSLRWSSRTHTNCPSYLSGLSPLPTLSYHTGFLCIPRTFQAWPWLRTCALCFLSSEYSFSWYFHGSLSRLLQDFTQMASFYWGLT